MPDKTDYARKCQQLDVLIDLLERKNKRLGISTFAELEAMSNEQIANIRGLGLRGYREILEKLGRQTDDRAGSKSNH